MSDGQKSIIYKDYETLGEREEKKENDRKRYKIQSTDIPLKVTKIEVYFPEIEWCILSLIIHGQEGDPLWVGPTEQSEFFKKWKGRKETFEVP